MGTHRGFDRAYVVLRKLHRAWCRCLVSLGAWALAFVGLCFRHLLHRRNIAVSHV